MIRRIPTLVVQVDEELYADKFHMGFSGSTSDESMPAMGPGFGFWEKGMEKLICGDYVNTNWQPGTGANRVNSIGVIGDKALTDDFKVFMQSSFNQTFKSVRNSYTQAYQASSPTITSALVAKTFPEGKAICRIVDSKTYAQSLISRDVNDYLENTLIKVFSSEDEVKEYVRNGKYGADEKHIPLMAVVNFKSDTTYTLRLNKTQRGGLEVTESKEVQLLGVRNYLSTWKTFPNTGLMVVQHHIEVFLAARKKKLDAMTVLADTTVLHAPLGQPKHERDDFYSLVGTYVFLLCNFGFLVGFASIIKVMNYESKSKITETFKILGVSSSKQICVWAFHYQLYYLFICVLANIILGPLFKNSSSILIFFLFFFYACAITSYAIFVANFMRKTAYPGIFSVLIWFGLGQMPALFETSSSEVNAIATILNPMVGFSKCLNGALELESAYTGVNFQTANLVFPSANTTYTAVILILFLDIFLWLLLAIYFDMVLPSSFGTSKPLCFCLKRSATLSLIHI